MSKKSNSIASAMLARYTAGMARDGFSYEDIRYALSTGLQALKGANNPEDMLKNLVDVETKIMTGEELMELLKSKKCDCPKCRAKRSAARQFDQGEGRSDV